MGGWARQSGQRARETGIVGWSASAARDSTLLQTSGILWIGREAFIINLLR